MTSRTTSEWQSILDARGVPASGVALPIEMLDAEQPAANSMFHRYGHPAPGPVTVRGAPLAQGDGGFAPGPPTSPFGSQTREILDWARFAECHVKRLLAGGAIVPTPT